jgi:DNA-binding FrmR family transcriptional regulator
MTMAHTVREKNKILARVNRIKGQLEAFSKAIESEEDCYKVMQLLSSVRGALNGLMGEVVEGHIREHIIEAENKKLAEESGEDLIEIMKSFWK